MDTTEMFRQLQEHVDKLHVLLKDPQRGLLTWNTLVGKEWQWTVTDRRCVKRALTWNTLVGKEWQAIAELWERPQ